MKGCFRESKKMASALIKAHGDSCLARAGKNKHPLSAAAEAGVSRLVPLRKPDTCRNAYLQMFTVCLDDIFIPCEGILLISLHGPVPFIIAVHINHAISLFHFTCRE